MAKRSSAPAAQPGTIAGIAADRLAAFAANEACVYAKARPKSRAAQRGGAAVWLDDVPMHWMKDWPQPFPMVVDFAKGAEIIDIDGNRIDDFCLGDTGSMFGHSPEPVARALGQQARRGLTYMLPTQAAFAAGKLLSHVFGPYRWQIATTATDANRFALRVARAVTGRPRVLVFKGCYHGTVDDAMVTRDARGRTVNRPGLLGQAADLRAVAACAEFNDLASVEEQLRSGTIAAILTEPVMTNSCMVLPDRGFLEGLRQLATDHGALLIIDETHTISTGLGGYSRCHGLEPDMFVVGKCVAGGVPAAVWGMTDEVARRYRAVNATRSPGHSGMGTTLSANPVQFACLTATLAKVMTAENYERMDRRAARLEKGLSEVITRHGAPWHVVRVGARVEFICAPGPLRNGTEAAAAHKPEVEAAMNLGLLNRGCLIAPFHNMMLCSPVTRKAQVDRLIRAFDACLGVLFGKVLQ